MRVGVMRKEKSKTQLLKYFCHSKCPCVFPASGGRGTVRKYVGRQVGRQAGIDQQARLC